MTVRPFGARLATVSEETDFTAGLEFGYDTDRQVGLVKHDGEWGETTAHRIAEASLWGFTGWQGGVPMDTQDI